MHIDPSSAMRGQPITSYDGLLLLRRWFW